MATRIIRAAPAFKEFEITCVNCQCIFSADDPKDFERCQGGDQRDYWDYAVIDCPSCKGQVKVNSEKFPTHIYSSLRSV